MYGGPCHPDAGTSFGPQAPTRDLGAFWVLSTRDREYLAPQATSWWVGSSETCWHRLNV